MSTDRAADCHAHVFCGAAYPYAAQPVYTPHPSQAGTVEQLLAVLDTHGLTHGLLVGAQPYGPDNRCLLGVNLSTCGMRELTEPGADRLFARIKEMSWFLQIHCEKDELVPAAPILVRAGVRVMVDHFGRPDVARGLRQPGFQALLALGRSGAAVVKLSGPFRSSVAGHPYHDVDPFVAAAIEAFTLERCVWGSDWPFVRMDQRVDYGPGLACLPRWLPDPRDRRTVLWDTPARLFGF